MTDEEKRAYTEQIVGAINECLDGTDTKHGLLIVANATGMLSLYSININEADLPMLVGAASQVVCARASELPS